MRDPLGLNERAFAIWYPRMVARSERAGQADTRRELLADASGRTLEIGPGNGFNLQHYTAAVTELVLCEPSPHMRGQLRRTLEDDPPPVGTWEIAEAVGEELPFDDSSFDTVVATFVLCSTPDPALALRELARVLKPGGRYHFLEHVHRGEGTMLGRFQDLIEIPHRYVAAGCHPNRRTERLLAESPFEVKRMQHLDMPRSAPSVRPNIAGVAEVAA